MGKGHKTCSKCGYDLTGLPGVGACPECGEVFNMFTGEGVRLPGSVAADTEQTIRWFKVWFGAGIVVFLLTCSGLIQWLLPPRKPFILGCVLATIPALWALSNYMDTRN